MNKRTAILMDGANNYATCKGLKFSMDFDKLLQLERFGTIVRPYYFTALPHKDVQSTLRPLVDHLEFHGWTVIQKQTTEWQNEDGLKVKGDMDGELFLTAVDIALDYSPPVSDIALFSGDGDFRCLVEWLQRKGIRVTVYSTLKTPQPMCADVLRRQADAFVDIADLRIELARLENAKPVSTPVRGGFLSKGRVA